MPLESSKKELGLSINTFNKPTEYIGTTAWSQLIMNLLFLRPGTYPSIPNMGIGIQDYEFEFLDVTIEKLNTAINSQIQLYLPDIPLESVNVSSFVHEGRTILYIAINLYNNGAISTSVVASEVSTKIIDFEISWPN